MRGVGLPANDTFENRSPLGRTLTLPSLSKGEATHKPIACSDLLTHANDNRPTLPSAIRRYFDTLFRPKLA
jgi:hypothetical protein